jgi:tetratricopeptide (TPR) repeat protein
MFLQLFDLIDKMDNFDEALIYRKIDNLEKTQFSNLKRHLYKQILISLRLIHIKRKIHIEIREQIDFAQILYDKGLYLQALKLLQRAKNLAYKVSNEILILEIIEFEKIIESRHITRTGPAKNLELTDEANTIIITLANEIKLSNIRMNLHSFYIEGGHVRSQEEYDKISLFLEDNLPQMDYDKMSFREQIFLYQSLVWYNYILLDFERCYTFALKWINALSENPIMIERDPDNYMRAYHYLLTSTFNINDYENFTRHLRDLEKYRKTKYGKFNSTSQIISFLYVHMARLNKHFLEGTFDEGVKIIPRTLRRIKKYKEKMDTHRIFVFYYKIAWMHLGNGNPGRAIDYLNKIINADNKSNLRSDIQAYSRIMFLMAHYDEENYEIIEYLVRNVRKYVDKIEQKDMLLTQSLDFFKKIVRLPLGDRRQALTNFNKELIMIKDAPYEKRAFLYLDITLWVQSKIRGLSLQQIAKERFQVQQQKF